MGLLFVLPAYSPCRALLDGLVDLRLQIGARIVIDHVCETIFSQLEDLRADLFADAIAYAFIMVNDRFHPRTPFARLPNSFSTETDLRPRIRPRAFSRRYCRLGWVTIQAVVLG